MIAPTKWDSAPSGFVLRNVDNKENQEPLIAFHSPTGSILFRLTLDDNERRQLIEGNPLYMLIVGPMTSPFALSANLADMTELVRGSD